MTMLPDFMPIVAPRMAAYRSPYVEREITEPCDLCDASGRLNPSAIGWSRTPLVRANLRGRWPRKKRWNFWNWISPEFVLSVTVADVDLAAFCEVSFDDFRSGRHVSVLAPAWPGSVAMSDEVERGIEFRGKAVDFRILHKGEALHVALRADAKGTRIAGEFVVAKPPGHETLNLVVPWSDDRFQCNSKHSALPTMGWLDVGGERHAMRPEECHGVQDWGRGVWPHVAFWNWGVASGVQDGRSVGVNVGAKWTTGTGVNENALCIDGRLHKISEDLVWTYDTSDWKRPWHVVAPQTRMVDLVLTPVTVRTPQVGFGPLRSGGACAFGRWSGAIRWDGGELHLDELPGWAEEFDHRW